MTSPPLTTAADLNAMTPFAHSSAPPACFKAASWDCASNSCGGTCALYIQLMADSATGFGKWQLLQRLLRLLPPPPHPPPPPPHPAPAPAASANPLLRRFVFRFDREHRLPPVPPPGCGMAMCEGDSPFEDQYGSSWCVGFPRTASLPPFVGLQTRFRHQVFCLLSLFHQPPCRLGAIKKTTGHHRLSHPLHCACTTAATESCTPGFVALREFFVCQYSPAALGTAERPYPAVQCSNASSCLPNGTAADGEDIAAAVRAGHVDGGANATNSSGCEDAPDDGSQVDVLVLYTAAALAENGGLAFNLLLKAEVAIDEVNRGLSNSQVALQLNL